MAKIVSLSEKAYMELSKIKKDKSFSEVVLELVEKGKKSNKDEVLRFFGKDLIDEKAIKGLRKGWKKWSERYA